MIELNVWGDSIAKGVVYDEERRRYTICRKNCLSRLQDAGLANVRNYSVMGQTTKNGMERMFLSDMRPGQIAVIEYGGNDCDLDWRGVSEHPDKQQNGKIPLGVFQKNMADMISRLRAAGVRPVLVTPPPLNAERYFRWVSKGLSADNILKYLGSVQAIFTWHKGYVDCIRATAEKNNVFLADLWQVFSGAEDLMCIDGIHPNEKGHEAMYRAAAEMLQSAAIV